MGEKASGWYEDPSKRHELRWHNGSSWTTAVMDGDVQGVDDPRIVTELPDESLSSSALTARSANQGSQGDVVGASIVALVAAVVLLVGALMPWATATAPLVGTVEAAGTDGDGKITIALAAFIGLMALVNMRRPIRSSAGVLVLLAGAAAAIVVAVDMANVSDKIRDVEDASDLVKADIGVGLWLSLVGAVVAAGAGLGMIGQREEPTTVSPEGSPPALGETM